MRRDKYVCEDCFDDYAVGEFIRREAVELRCDYCEIESETEAISAPLSDVARFIREGIETEWSDPDDEAVPWDSEEDRYIVEVYDTYDLLLDLLSISSDELLDDLSSELGDRNWCQRNPARFTKQEELYFNWEAFSEQLKHHTRYVFYRVEHERDEFDDRSVTPHDILNTIADLVLEQELLRTLPAGTTLVRARPHPEDEAYSTVEDLGPPPEEKAVHANRMSPAGIPMFYGSDTEETALGEIDQIGFATVASFKTLKAFQVLDLTQIPAVPSLFDQQRGHHRPAIIFLTNFLDDFTKEVKKDGREHIEYVPTQVVTEYFRRVFRTIEGDRLRGVIYPSARIEGGISYVLFFTNEDCTQDDDSEERNEKWLSMVTSSVIRIDLRARPAVKSIFRLRN
jgi:hypothetical protein